MSIETLPAHTTRRWTDAEKQEAFKLRKEGKSVSDIAKQLGRTYKSVHCLISREFGTKVFRDERKKNVDS